MTANSTRCPSNWKLETRNWVLATGDRRLATGDWLLALWAIYVRGVAEEDLGRLHHRFRQRRVRMDRHRHIFGGGAHFDGEHAFRDQLARTRAADADTEDALALGMDDQLGHTVGAPERNRTAGCAPRELGDGDLEALLLGFRLGQARPCNLGIGEHDRGNRERRELDVAIAGNRVDGRAPFVRRLVRQHRLARDVADRVDVRLAGTPALVSDDEAALVDFDAQLVEAGNRRVGTPADRDQHAIEGLIAGLAFSLEGDGNAIPDRFHPGDLGVEPHGLGDLADALGQDARKLALRARQHPAGHLDDRHLAADRRVDAAQFETDITA